MDIAHQFGCENSQEKKAADMAEGLQDGFVFGNKLIALMAKETIGKSEAYRLSFLDGLKDAI